MIRVIAKLLFPPRCKACKQLLPFRGIDREDPDVLCHDCKQLWESERLDVCGYCGEPVSKCACMPSELKRAKCELLRKAVYYFPQKKDAVQNRLIYFAKDHPSRLVASFFAQQLSETVGELLSEYSLTPSDTVIVYIPRSRKSVRATGTDQSESLARALSQRTGVQVLSAIVRKPLKNKPQKSLGLKERLLNAIESYEPAQDTSLKGKNVLLLDDIVTTGASMAVASRLLKRAGAERVFGLVIAYDEANKLPREEQPKFRI